MRTLAPHPQFLAANSIPIRLSWLKRGPTVVDKNRSMQAILWEKRERGYFQNHVPCFSFPA